MAKYRVVTPDGESHMVDAPDDATPDQIKNYVMQQQSAPKATQDQKLTASTAGRLLQGVRDPIDAGAQLLPKALGAVTSGFGYMPNKVSDFFDAEANRVTGMNAAQEQKLQEARAATGQSGFDGARMVGNVVSPANLALARLLPMAPGAGIGKMATQGALAGAAGGALTPVNESDNFWGAKASQMGAGAVTGAVLAPVLGKIANAATNWLTRNSAATKLGAAAAADEAIAKVLQESGQKITDLAESDLNALRQQVTASLASGKNLDPAALARKADFDSIGVQPTLGQITRDATTFARERNQRAIPNAGEPLLNRFAQQNQRLAELLSGKASNTEPFQAGGQIAESLAAFDSKAQKAVGSLYNAVRDSEGRYAKFDVQAFSKAANDALDAEMAGAALPDKARTLLNELSSGKFPVNVNTLLQADKQLSKMQNGADDAGKYAIGIVRKALNAAPIEAEAGVETKAAYDAARGAAKLRFDVRDGIPALKDAANGGIASERFADKYLLGGKAEKVKSLAYLLKNTDKAAFTEAKGQIGAALYRAAFGENAAGDNLFRPEMYSKALRQIGDEKLRAFFSPEEISQLKTISRVGAAINSTPSAAPVMGNPNMTWATSLLAKFPGVPSAVSILKAGADIALRNRQISASVAAKVPEQAAQMTPQQQAAIAKLLSASGVVAGGALAPRQ